MTLFKGSVLDQFYLLIFIPFVWVIIAKVLFHAHLDITEIISMLVFSGLFTSAMYFGGMSYQTADTQILNGRVTGKDVTRVSCAHSYSCNCQKICTSTKSGPSCVDHCSTCYRHSFDNRWNINSTLQSFTVSNIDSQGLKEPSRWTSAVVDEPVSVRSSYQNYIKEVPESLFHFNHAVVLQYKGQIPAYPDAVYDLYRINRFIPVGMSFPDAKLWNDGISKRLINLGASKEVNIVIVATDKSSSYGDALEAAWYGGKKNDVVIVVGLEKDHKISWVKVMALTKKGMFKVAMRDAILDAKMFEREPILDIVYHTILKEYSRQSMKEYEYLKEEISTPIWLAVTIIVLNLLTLGGLTYWFRKVNMWQGIKNLFPGRRRK